MHIEFFFSKSLDWFCLYHYICTNLLLLELKKKREQKLHLLITHLSSRRTNLFFLPSIINFHIWEQRHTFSCWVFYLQDSSLINLSAKHNLKLFYYTSTYVKWMRSQNIQNTKNILSHLKQKFQSTYLRKNKLQKNLQQFKSWKKIFKCTMLF